jgi:hypothetical protein
MIGAGRVEIQRKSQYRVAAAPAHARPVYVRSLDRERSVFEIIIKVYDVDVT